MQPSARTRRLVPWLLRIFRLLVFAGIVWSIHRKTQWLAAQRDNTLTLEMARQLFPEAASLGSVDPATGFVEVLGPDGTSMGTAAKTLPQSQRITGYSGPHDLLIGRGPDGNLLDVKLLRSRDTPEHVEMVQESATFWQQLRNIPAEVDAVSGASLTSHSMVESVRHRLNQQPEAGPSKIFPEEPTLAEMRRLFPSATSTVLENGRYAVRQAESLLGYVWRTSPESERVSGYRGPTDVLVALDPTETTVLGIALGKTYDNASYVDVVRDDRGYLALFKGRTVETLANLDYEKEGIEGVSGSTLTSYAVAESLKRRCQAALKQKTVLETAAAPKVAWKWQDGLTIFFLLGSTVMAFSSWRGKPWLRRTWQVLLAGGFVFLTGSFLNLALFVGWAQHGVPWRIVPSLLLLAAAALLAPWAARRQLYCHQICPYGAMQEWVGKISPKKWSLASKWAKRAESLPGLLLAVAIVLAILGTSTNFAAWEPFDGLLFRAGAWISLTLALIGLLASLRIPQAYCRFGCPTGAVFKFLRSSGSTDHWGMRDTAGAVLLALAVLLH